MRKTREAEEENVGRRRGGEKSGGVAFAGTLGPLSQRGLTARVEVDAVSERESGGTGRRETGLFDCEAGWQGEGRPGPFGSVGARAGARARQDTGGPGHLVSSPVWVSRRPGDAK